MLPSTQQLAGGARLRLTLQDSTPWYAVTVSTAGLAQNFYTTGIVNTPVLPIAPPSAPNGGVWVQDVQVRAGQGLVTVDQLVQQASQATGGYLKVIDSRLLQAAELGTNSAAAAARDTEAKTAAAQVAKDHPGVVANLKSWWSGLTGVLATLRLVFVGVLVLGLLWYAWPWVGAWLRSWRKRKTAAA